MRKIATDYEGDCSRIKDLVRFLMCANEAVLAVLAVLVFAAWRFGGAGSEEQVLEALCSGLQGL